MMRRMDAISAKGNNGLVTFDGAFVTITRKGVMARLTIGKGEKRIPIASISSVQWKPPGPLMNGFISFSLGGGNERMSRFGHQTSTAASDENSVIVTRGQAKAFLELRGAIEGAIAARNAPAPQTAPDVIAQLEGLGQLRDAGVLTEDEFQQKKADLLDRM